MLSYHNLHLNNGLRVITVEQPHLHSASISLYVRSGSRYETAAEWGLSHLVEHMLFRGSQKFPDGRLLAEAFERAGGTLEASTWRDHTSIATPLHPSCLGPVLTALADMVLHPLFLDLDIERRVVAEELQGDLDENGEDVCPHNLSRASIWHQHAMGRRVGGSLATLESFSSDDVTRHHAKHYVGQNMVLCVAGRVKHQDVARLASDLFGALPQGQRIEDGGPALFAPQSRLVTRELRGAQLAVQLTFESLPYGHPDFTALELLTRVLDNGMSSRLHQAVCERQGLVYELSTGLDCYTDCGLYDVALKAAPRHAASAVETVLQTLRELCERGISDEELEQVRRQSLHELEFRVDSSVDLSDQYGCGALFGHTDTLESEAAHLQHVSNADVIRVARTMFSNGQPHATLVGPVQRANMAKLENACAAYNFADNAFSAA